MNLPLASMLIFQVAGVGWGAMGWAGLGLAGVGWGAVPDINMTCSKGAT